jgi:single-strand DNA-binding protein
MAGGLNECCFIGRMGQDPEKRFTSSGKAVTNVSIAVTTKFGQTENTEWISLVFWNKPAEIIEQYCRKGSQIWVRARQETQSWEHEGQKKYKVVHVVEAFRLLDAKPQSQQDQQFNPQTPPNQATNDDFVDDDIPF